MIESGVELEGEDEHSLAKRWGGPEMKKWHQKAADERALSMLMEIQRRDEGVAEFLELAGVALKEPLDIKVEDVVHDEVKEEPFG